MKIGLKNIIIIFILFGGSGYYFFFKSANNTKGLIINNIFKLNVGQANTFYFVLGCFGILVLLLCGVVYLKNKPNDKQGREKSPDKLQQAIPENNEDYLKGAKIGAKDVFNRLLNAMKDEKGVHIESFLCMIGALAGYSCQASIRSEFIDEKGLTESKVFVVVECVDGSRYFCGDILNKPLAESQYSVWSLAARAIQHLGVNELINIQEIFEHVTKTIGDKSFGIPRIPEGHNTGDIPYNYVRSLWPVVLPIIKSYCPAHEWPILFGLAAQEAIIFCKDAIDPSLALSIVMESAVPMSKVDLKLL